MFWCHLNSTGIVWIQGWLDPALPFHQESIPTLSAAHPNARGGLQRFFFPGRSCESTKKWAQQNREGFVPPSDAAQAALQHTKALGAFISQLQLREGFSLHGKAPGRLILMEKGFGWGKEQQSSLEQGCAAEIHNYYTRGRLGEAWNNLGWGWCPWSWNGIRFKVPSNPN